MRHAERVRKLGIVLEIVSVASVRAIWMGKDSSNISMGLSRLQSGKLRGDDRAWGSDVMS